MTDGSSLVWDAHPELEDPALVAAFKGWNDAGDAASEAASWLVRTAQAQRFAWIDPEDHYDFQSSRPHIELIDGVTRELTWPMTECYSARLPGAARDLVVVIGVEPNYRWRAFSRSLVDLAEITGCTLVTTLGAVLADVPHTREVTVTGTASNTEVSEQLGMTLPRYEGPTGILGVLQDTCTTLHRPSASLWVPIPHYLAGPPHPAATHALLERLAGMLDVPVALDDLRVAAQRWRARVDEAIAEDPNARRYVEELETRTDESERPLPSGDELAAELEQFLRDRPED